MAGKKKQPDNLPESITLSYRLDELPTAQHKAGLAGMLLLIENLKERKAKNHSVGELPERLHLSRNEAVIRFTQAGLQTLIDDFYDAAVVTTKKDKERIQPTINFSRFFLAANHEPWTKLYGDALTSVIYSKPTTWNPFKDRASGSQVKRFSDTTTRELFGNLAAEQPESKAVHDIKGQHLIGAETENAECVGFSSESKLFLTLHFWIIASPIFVPRILKEERDQASGERYLDRKFDDPKRGVKARFLIAVPEVADLKWFVEKMRDYWRGLSGNVDWYRPADSIIDVPYEAGFELLFGLASQKAEALEACTALLAIELYCLSLEGKGPVKNVRILSADRLKPDPAMLDDYALHLRDRNANPLFKRLALSNLVAGRPWYADPQPLFAHYPAEYFVGHPAKSNFRRFGYDARKHFEQLIEQLSLISQALEATMTDTFQDTLDEALVRRIYQMIGAYVHVRAQEKWGKALPKDLPKDSAGKTQYPHEYLEAREKVARDAFLALRGRRAGDIAEYFTGTLCTVTHYLNEEDFIIVSRALVEKPEQLKDLTMLALSAHG